MKKQQQPAIYMCCWWQRRWWLLMHNIVELTQVNLAYARCANKTNIINYVLYFNINLVDVEHVYMRRTSNTPLIHMYEVMMLCVRDGPGPGKIFIIIIYSLSIHPPMRCGKKDRNHSKIFRFRYFGDRTANLFVYCLFDNIFSTFGWEHTRSRNCWIALASINERINLKCHSFCAIPEPDGGQSQTAYSLIAHENVRRNYSGWPKNLLILPSRRHHATKIETIWATGQVAHETLAFYVSRVFDK